MLNAKFKFYESLAKFGEKKLVHPVYLFLYFSFSDIFSLRGLSSQSSTAIKCRQTTTGWPLLITRRTAMDQSMFHLVTISKTSYGCDSTKKLDHFYIKKFKF
jgi:hypothetical protein